MMTSWRIKNFKVWQDTGSIKLAPLTVFFGENSAGKSSLGQLLLALKQSAGSSAAQPSLNFGDGQSLIDLGSFAQNLHCGQLTEPLQFELRWRLPEPLALPDVAPQQSQSIDELCLTVSVIADQAQQPQLQSMCYSGFQDGIEQLSVIYCSDNKAQLQVSIKQPQVLEYSLKLADAARPEQFYRLPATQGQEAAFLTTLAVQTERVLADFQALAALRAGPQRRYAWHGETPASVGRAGEAAIAAVLAANAQQRKLQFAVDQPELDF